MYIETQNLIKKINIFGRIRISNPNLGRKHILIILTHGRDDDCF